MKRFYSIFDLIITWLRPIFNVTVHWSHTELAKLSNMFSAVIAFNTLHCSTYFNPSRANLRNHMLALHLLKTCLWNRRNSYALVATRDFVLKWEAFGPISSRHFHVRTLDRSISAWVLNTASRKPRLVLSIYFACHPVRARQQQGPHACASIEKQTSPPKLGGWEQKKAATSCFGERRA